MFNKTIILILIIAFFASVESKGNVTKCTKLLGQVADAQSRFVDCMVKNASPAKSCLECMVHNNYHNMTDKYKKLVSFPNCTKDVINANRLRIVYNMQTYLEDLWNKAYCDDCAPSNETSKFLDLKNTFENCLEMNTNKTNICVTCSGPYDNLNSFYKQMETAKQGKICFDTQDIMNRTRSLWSKDLNCCHREYSLMLFIIASSLFGALTIGFYLGMYSYAKRIERNHEILDANLNSEPASTSTGIISGTVSNTEIPTNTGIPPTIEANEESIDELKKYKKQLNASSSKNSSIPKGKYSDSENIKKSKMVQEEPGNESTNANNPLIDL